VHRFQQADRPGQVVDVALYESVFNLLEGVVPEYSGAGVVRGPSGSTITGIAPTNTYRCADGKYIIIGANGDSIFRRLCEAMGRPDLGRDPRLADNRGRVEHESELDGIIGAWTAGLDSTAALALLEQARVPSGPIYSVADMFSDEHFIARGLFEEVDIDGKPLKIPALVPRLSATPGRTDWPGGAVGAHNAAVYGELLGVDAAELQALEQKGIV
jgi:crotonobetainyl-CoA:carnitine CoA-transferase CaiB-like acyl-CoA transferase